MTPKEKEEALKKTITAGWVSVMIAYQDLKIVSKETSFLLVKWIESFTDLETKAKAAREMALIVAKSYSEEELMNHFQTLKKSMKEEESITCN